MEVQQCLIFSLLKIYTVCKAHHYTQQEISDLLNISRQAYSLTIETSKRTPDLDSLMRLADIYGVSLDQLVNHPCTKDGLILEQKGPFTYARWRSTLPIHSSYAEEVELIKGYWAANPEDKLLLKKTVVIKKRKSASSSRISFFIILSKSLVNCIDRTFYIAFIDQNRDST